MRDSFCAYGWPEVKGERKRSGFTLIEILIVISIIALLSSFVLVAVSKGKQGAAEALVTTMVSNLNNALQQYVQDEGTYPAIDKKTNPQRNDFPELFNALFGDRKPNGPGGRNAPYMQIKQDQVVVWDEDTESYRKATPSEINKAEDKKYILDAWGQPYVYRCNKGKKREDWMKNAQSADIYSTGPNETDDTIEGSEKSDDIGNW